MRGVFLHGGLLLAALVASVLTWTGSRPLVVQSERTVVWDRDTTEITAIEYRSESHDIDITRRTFETGEYLWGVESRRGGPTDAVESRLEFPAGAPGADLVEGLARLGVVRDLGPLDEDNAPRFGLSEPGATLTVVFGGERRELAIGNETPGGADRYGDDRTAGRAYVIPGGLVSPLETGVGALRERRIHYFGAADIMSVRVEVGERSRLMVRSGEDQLGGATWASSDTPDRPDQTFANFMERIGQLAIEGFRNRTDLPLMERRLRMEYFDDDGESIGFTELHRSVVGPGSGPAEVEFFVLSERMPVPADAIRSLAERVDADLEEIF